MVHLKYRLSLIVELGCALPLLLAGLNACCCGGALAGHSAQHGGGPQPDVDADGHADVEVDSDDCRDDAAAAGGDDSDKTGGTVKAAAAGTG